MADVQTTTAQEGSRLLFSRYKSGKDHSWSLRWRVTNGRPVTLCRSQRDSLKITHDVMEEFFDDPRVEAILADIVRRRASEEL